MLELTNYNAKNQLEATLIAKLELFNPASSVKDRIGYAMIKDAEDKNLIQKGDVIVEPTSGNTGIGLAFVCAARGYRLILTMPDTMSQERRDLLKALGAELFLPQALKGWMVLSRRQKNLQLLFQTLIPQQFSNPANPEVHRKTTAEEIWADTQDG